MFLFQCFSGVLVGSLCIHRQSWFDGDDILSFRIVFPRFSGVLDGYARYRLCGVDWKVFSRGFATFREHMRNWKHMLGDSALRYAYQMPLLTEQGVEMTPRAVEQLLSLVDVRFVTVMESMPKFSVAQANEFEGDECAVGQSFFSLVSEVDSTSRTWLSLKDEHIPGGGCFDDLMAHWHGVKQFPLSRRSGHFRDQRLDCSGKYLFSEWMVGSNIAK